MKLEIQTKPAEIAISREELRTFHIAGRGLEPFTPNKPLWPALLDQLPPLLAPQTVDVCSLYAKARSLVRDKSRSDFFEELRQVRERLQEILWSESRSESPPNSFGKAAGFFFDATALSAALRGRTRGSELAPERRKRIETLIRALDEALQQASTQPPFWRFDSSHAAEEGDLISAAIAFTYRELERFSTLLRVLRTARLEIESAYEPEIHDEILNRLDWQSAGADELAALPPVVIIETAERLAQTPVGSLAKLLSSGRPIHALIISEDLDPALPDFGYLAIAHREAFVLQSSVAKPEHLSNGLKELASKLRPAIAVVSVVEAPALVLSRAFPLYRYDPDHGDTWADRFELLVEPSQGVTAAHAAALSESFRHHFRIIPDSAWHDEQMELQSYLQAWNQQPPLAIPYLWILDEKGIPQRAILTRELVSVVRDRERAWKVLAELAGVENSHVEAALARSRQDSLESARTEGAREAIHRVVAMLAGSPLPAPSLQSGECAADQGCGGNCESCRTL